jgi:hypothetical protein
MNFYETPDLGLTASFITLGYPVRGTTTKDGKVFFTFEYSSHLMDLASKYFGSGLEVDAKSYYYNLRDLKKVIYENTK